MPKTSRYVPTRSIRSLVTGDALYRDHCSRFSQDRVTIEDVNIGSSRTIRPIREHRTGSNCLSDKYMLSVPCLTTVGSMILSTHWTNTISRTNRAFRHMLVPLWTTSSVEHIWYQLQSGKLQHEHVWYVMEDRTFWVYSPPDVTGLTGDEDTDLSEAGGQTSIDAFCTRHRHVALWRLYNALVLIMANHIGHHALTRSNIRNRLKKLEHQCT